MQSIASILEKEANFVVLFNEATHNNHQFGGYPNEQYQLYMKYGDEFMADKWGNETITLSDGRVVKNVNVWSEVKQLAWIKAMRTNVNAHKVKSCPTGNLWCNKSNPCTNCWFGNYYGE